MKTKLVLLTIIGALVVSTFAQSMEKTTIEKHKEFLDQQKKPSNVMRWMNKNFGKFVLDDYASKPASSFHQELWKKAQDDLNIPEQYHAPIVEFDDEKNDLFKGDNLSIAGIMNDKMYVNDEIHKLDYTISRFNHYHEAAHHKYLDPFNTWARKLFFKISAAGLTLGSAFGLPCSLLYATSKIKNPKISSLLCRFPATTFLTLLTSYISTIPASLLLRDYAIYPLIIPLMHKNLEKYSQLIERRADLEAAHAIKCDQCIQARANRYKNGSPKDQELFDKMGYLSGQELEAIAQEHKRNGLVCDYHKK